MLKPISQPFCSGALNACLELQMYLLRWLCDPAVAANDVTELGLTPPRVPTAIEASWLWRFLRGRKQTRLNQAKTIAEASAAEKVQLLDWCSSVAAIAVQFQPAPPPWPTSLPAISAATWSAFKDLMEAFYEHGLKSGLPYRDDGTPVASGGVDYAAFVKAFRGAHSLDSNANAREVCVLCGGRLGDTPEVDHWINKSAFPLLSVCADNLLAVCGDCNSTTNKGGKHVHSLGNFAEWFHPYFRPADGALRLRYSLPALAVECSSVHLADREKADNLNRLLNLAQRWTREFKAEYASQQGVLRRRERDRIRRGEARQTQAEVQAYLIQQQNDLGPSEPHYEVYELLYSAMLEQARLSVWHSELGLVS